METETKVSPTATARDEIDARIRVLDAIDQAVIELGVECVPISANNHFRLAESSPVTEEEAVRWVRAHTTVMKRAAKILGWTRFYASGGIAYAFPDPDKPGAIAVDSTGWERRGTSLVADAIREVEES